MNARSHFIFRLFDLAARRSGPTIDLMEQVRMNNQKPSQTRAKAGILTKPTIPSVPARKEAVTSPSKSSAQANKKEPTADDALVTDAARHIREVLQQKAARGLDEIGAYVFEKFYGNDAVAYTSKSHSKPVSLTSLERRCNTQELPISRTALATAVRIVVTSRWLSPEAAFVRLPHGFRVELLPLRKADKIEKLAARIIADPSLTVRKVREMVRAQLGKSSGDSRSGGKPRNVVEAVERVVSMLVDRSSAPLYDRRHVEALTNEERTTLHKKLDHATRLIAGLDELLPGPKRSDVGTHGKAVAA